MISTELSPLNIILDVRRHTLAHSEYYGRLERCHGRQRTLADSQTDNVEERMDSMVR
jgi:hypothetical protein